VRESIIHVFPPPTCISHTVATLMHDYWAVYEPPPPTSLVYAIHPTRFVITISCKGQVRARLHPTRLTTPPTPAFVLQAGTLEPASWSPRTPSLQLRSLAFTRYYFAAKLYCGSPSFLYSPSPLAKPTLLLYYCTTIGHYTPSYRPPFCMP